MKFRGITKRWFVDVALMVIIILLIVASTLIVSLRNYYYGAVEMTLDSYSGDKLASMFSLYGNEKSGFAVVGRELIEAFPEKDIMEVWLIDSSGRVTLSTSGFEIAQDVDMPDYAMAMSSDTYIGKWTGRLATGEKIMAMTSAYDYSSGGHAGAVRLMISMRNVDRQLAMVSMLIFTVCAALIVIIIFSGVFFIGSILNPVKSISLTARQIAGGDLNARIEGYSHSDEIGELCSTVNDMADKLATADKMKNDFISTVSHELRTPLTAIKGWGETLKQVGETDPAMMQRGMQVIISEAERLNDMVEELLDFSRMSNGRMRLNIEKIDVLAELDEVVFTFKERAIKEGKELIYNVTHLPAPVDGDAGRVKQVFSNILDNALKYTKQGGRIIVLAEIPTPSTLVITFSDTGIGISPEDLPRVKEKFYKTDTSVRGSGIGLAVADEIVRLHKGELSVDSILGEGTTVTITLPIDVVIINPVEGGSTADEQKEE